MFSHQDMDAASPAYGTIPWQVGHPEMRDANSIEFCIQPMGPVFKGYGTRLSPGFKGTITPHLQAAFAAMRRHNVPVTYTNIFLMKPVNLNSLLMGYRYAARPGGREKFKRILYFFWSDVAGNFFAPR